MSWLEDIQSNRKRQVEQMAKAFGYNEMNLRKAEDDGVDYSTDETEEETSGASKKKKSDGKSNMYKMKMLGLRKFNEQDHKDYVGVEDVDNSYITNLDNGDIVISKTDEGYLVSKFPIDENKEGEEKEAVDLSEAVDVALQFKEELDNDEDSPEQIMYKETEKAFEDEVNPFEKAAYEAEFGHDIEKAKHADGDMHPNGKWVWRSSANGGKGDWRVVSPSKRGGGAKTTTTSKSKINVKEVNDTVLSKIANKELKGVSDELANEAKKELESRKKPKVADVSKLTANEKQMVDKVVSNGFKIVSSKYNDKAKMSLEKTPKGNWRCYYDGRDIGSTIAVKLITDSTVKKMGWEHHDNKKEKDTKKVVHDINGTKVAVTKNTDGSYTLEANGKKVKTDDPSYFVNGTNLKLSVKRALAKEAGI